MARRLSALTDLDKYAVARSAAVASVWRQRPWCTRIRTVAALDYRRCRAVVPTRMHHAIASSAAGDVLERVEPGCARRDRSRHSPRSTSPTARSSPARIRPASCDATGGASCAAIDALEARRHRPVGRAERDGRPRQDQRRRAHRDASEAGAPAVPDRHRRAAPGRQQTRPRHRSGGHEHAAAARSCADWGEGRPAVCWPAPATTCAPGGSRRGNAMAPQPRLAIVATHPAGDLDAADDLRTGVPAVRVLAVHRLRDDPDRLAGHPDDARRASRSATTCSTSPSCCCSSRSATR